MQERKIVYLMPFNNNLVVKIINIYCWVFNFVVSDIVINITMLLHILLLLIVFFSTSEGLMDIEVGETKEVNRFSRVVKCLASEYN